MTKEEQIKQECDKFVKEKITQLKPNFKSISNYIISLEELQVIISKESLSLGDKLNQITENSKNQNELDKIALNHFNQSISRIINHFFGTN